MHERSTGSLIYIAHAAPDKPLIISSRHFILFLPYGGLISYKLLMAKYDEYNNLCLRFLM